MPDLRQALAAVAAAALVGAGAIVIVTSGDDGTGQADTAERDRDPGSTTGRPDAGVRPLTVEPGAGLTDGEVVTLALRNDPGGELVARQCAGEAVEPGAGGEAWCGRTEHHLRSPAGSAGLELRVSRSLTTARGRVDCAGRAARCIVLVHSAESGSDGPRWSGGLSFRSVPASADTPRLEVEGRARNGDAVTVTGSGYPAGDELLLRQCLGPDPSAPCGQARVASVTVGEDGSFEAPFVVSEQVLVDDGWTRCDPCALQTIGNLSPAVSSSPIAVAPAGDPVRPTVSIAERPPYVPGQRVTLEGSGFQLGAHGIAIGSCALPRDAASPDCTYPQAGFPTAVSTPDGTLRIDGYPLPAADHPCRAPGARCALAWYPNEGGPAAFLTELHSRGAAPATSGSDVHGGG